MLKSWSTVRTRALTRTVSLLVIYCFSLWGVAAGLTMLWSAPTRGSAARGQAFDHLREGTGPVGEGLEDVEVVVVQGEELNRVAGLA